MAFGDPKFVGGIRLGQRVTHGFWVEPRPRRFGSLGLDDETRVEFGVADHHVLHADGARKRRKTRGAEQTKLEGRGRGRWSLQTDHLLLAAAPRGRELTKAAASMVDGDRAPGDHGLDPSGLIGDPKRAAGEKTRTERSRGFGPQLVLPLGLASEVPKRKPLTGIRATEATSMATSVFTHRPWRTTARDATGGSEARP